MPEYVGFPIVKKDSLLLNTYALVACIQVKQAMNNLLDFTHCLEKNLELF